MRVQRFFQPSRVWPWVADASLLVILMGMIQLTLPHVGVAASLPDPITVWYNLSAAWLGLVVAFFRCPAHQREALQRRARTVLIVAVLCTALPSGLFTDDALRYQWDGWLTTHRESPFTAAPESADLQYLRHPTGTAMLPDDLPYADMLTIYPPGAQLVFALASLASGGAALPWKLSMWVLFVALGAALWRAMDAAQRPWLLLVGLSPVVLLHGFIDVHIDLAMAFMMMLAFAARNRGYIIAGGMLLGAAVTIKYLPLLALPVLLSGLERRHQLRLTMAMVLSITVIYTPFLGPNLFGSLGTFTGSWQTNSLMYTFVASVAGEWLTRPILLSLAIAATSGVIVRWRREPLVAFALTLVVLYVLSPVVHPWYLLAPLALLPMVPLRSVIIWTASVTLYGAGLSTYKGSGVWLEHPAALAVEFIPVMVALIADVRRGPLSLLDEHRA